ncbi:MAG TPA: S53 family peptidase, partial [Nitrospiria bacterium]|nr:S53 family peptidase [Nitrospiria bacterium]
APASAQYAAFRALDPAAAIETLADGAILITPSSSFVRPGSGQAHTNFHLFHPAGGLPTANAANTAPPVAGNYNETPASIACIYALVTPVTTGCNPQNVFTVPTGGSGVIAIVDAFHAPNALPDLQAFINIFNLPPVDFQVVYATSAGTMTSTPPPYDSGWEMEISLDIQWAHAMAPGAKIILVEANSANLSDMFAAVALAGKMVTPFGGQVSNSWGTSEYLGETTNDSFFATGSNVVYFAASGDSPGTSYPAVSPNVVAVGGTTISRNRTTGNYVSQSAWSSGGGGPSRYEKRPSYQSSISRTVSSARGIPDVSAVADPNSGVWIYDSAAGGWIVVGGTSVATPVVAGITNLRGSFNASSTAELTYIYGNQSHYTDITSGSCRTHRATTNWDFCTGLGVPKRP